LVVLDGLGFAVHQVALGSGGDRHGSGFEEDVGVDESVGEGIEVTDGVEVALVGDASSIVLEDGEGAFCDGAGFVGLLEVGGGALQLEAMVVV
jgi:hypothetical protein